MKLCASGRSRLQADRSLSQSFLSYGPLPWQGIGSSSGASLPHRTCTLLPGVPECGALLLRRLSLPATVLPRPSAKATRVCVAAKDNTTAARVVA